MSARSKVNARKAILARAYVVFGLISVFAITILWRAAMLIGGGSKAIADGKSISSTRVTVVKAMRGNIYADDGSLLATSTPRYELVMDAYANGLTPELFNSSIDSLSMLFASRFQEKDAAGWKAYFLNLRKKKVRYAVVLKDLGFEQKKAMAEWPVIRLGKFKGFWYEEQFKRFYFMGDLAKRTIGYSRDGVYVGLEGAFDSLLSGTDGKRMEQRLPGNVWRPIDAGNNIEQQNGYDIVTTIDVNLQDVAQNALNTVLSENEADRGCALVMEVKTGAIKAIANLKRLKDGKYYDVQNFAVDEFSEPGSTFKLLSALALLEDGYAKPTDSIDNNWGEIQLGGKTMSDASKPSKRIYTLEECFVHSSNVGFSKFALKYYNKQPEKFINHLMDLNLNLKPDFDIKSSNHPLIMTPRNKNWSSIALPWMSIGYNVNLSPMQILMVYNAVANGGVMMKPYMVKEIKQEGRNIKNIEPVILNKRICSKETADALRKMMEGVVDHGTATNLKHLDFKVAGKTGTAQIAKGKGGYDKENYKSSFCGYFPADNPQYTVMVVINQPKKGNYYGAKVAGPVFKEIADKVYSMKFKYQASLLTSTKKQVPDILKGDAGKTILVLNKLNISSRTDSSGQTGTWVNPSKKEQSVLMTVMKTDERKVPDVKGMGIRDAMLLLERRGIKVKFKGYGRVVSQSINPGTAIGSGMEILLILEPF